MKLRRTLLGMAASQICPAGSILCFHGLSTPRHPAAGTMHVPLSVLRMAIEIGQEFGQIVPLWDLVKRHQSGHSTRGMFALTFDDAYASLEEGVAILREHGVAATVFVATDAARRGSTYWWDRLEGALANVTTERWRQFEKQCGLPARYRARTPAGEAPIWPLRQWLLEVHSGRWPEALSDAVTALETAARCTTIQRSMSFEELARFERTAPVTFAVHTRSHPVLPSLTAIEAQREIEQSHRALLDRFTNVIPVLAFPYGIYDQSSVQAAREAKMVASLTLGGRTLAGVTSLDVLPRFCMSSTEPAWKLRLRLSGIAEKLRPGPVPIEVT
jgi:peptidoglycan/xylan/chitin deacetylase (PgdA/CDA1 family)